MSDIPILDPDTLASATAGELIDLLVTHQDRAPRALFDACVARGDGMVAALADYLHRADAMEEDDEHYDWWMNIHGFWVAGAIPGDAAGRLLIDMLRRADIQDDATLDWVAGYMPWLFANKPSTVANLARTLAEDRDVGWFSRCEAVDAVVGMAHAESPAALNETLDWLAALISAPDEDKDLSRLGANLLLDFPRPRHRALLDRLAAEQESEPVLGLVFDSGDVARAFARQNDAPNWMRRGMPWNFYDAAQILARQERWREEDARAEERAARQAREEEMLGLIPEPYLRDMPKLGRNDPCHCGSGKKYKKCCLLADEARAATQRLFH